VPTLGTPPASLVTTRVALHRFATYVVAPARHQVTGRFGLRATPGGFGTPVFGDGIRVRVDGPDLVVDEGESSRRTPITSMNAAAEFIGSKVDLETAAEHDSPPAGDLDEDLGIDAEAVAYLASWWQLASEALEIVRTDAESVDPSEVQLWPGHFDPSIEIGDEDHRASYGGSPGDGGSDEPYAYVSVWWPDRIGDAVTDTFWSAEGYTGAVLPRSEIDAGDDPVATVVEFFRRARALLS